MPTVTGSPKTDYNFTDSNYIGVFFLDWLLGVNVINPSSAQFTLADYPNNQITFTGTGFTYSQGAPTGGTITSVQFKYSDGTAGQSWTGLNVSLATFWSDMVAAGSTGDLTAINNLFFSGNDTFTAQNYTDYFVGGSGGNNVFNMGPYFVNAHVDGSGGTNNTMNLDGNYAPGDPRYYQDYLGVANIQKITMTGAHDYAFAFGSDANVSTLIIDASAVTANGWLYFDGSSDTTTNFNIIGSAGNDTLIGGVANDVFTPGSGSDTINGNGSMNIADYSGNYASYTITRNADGSVTVTKPGGGTDKLSNIEQLVFADQTVMLGGTTTTAHAADDFNGDGMSDILWQNTNGQAAIWTMNGLSQLGGSQVGGDPGSNWKVVGAADFNSDGKADIVWQDSDNGQVVIWTMNGFNQLGSSFVGGAPGSDWKVVGTGDFAGNGQQDLLFQNTDGQAVMWTMNGTTQTGSAFVGGDPGTDWKIVGTGDFNGDGKADIVWQDTANGQVAIWTMNGTTQTGSYLIGGAPGANWVVEGVGDFAGDGNEDLLWQNTTTGQAVMWTMNGLNQTGSTFIGGDPGASWHIVGVGDYNGDGKADILWQNDNGQAAVWTMNGTTQLGGSPVGGNPGTAWHVIAGG